MLDELEQLMTFKGLSFSVFTMSTTILELFFFIKKNDVYVSVQKVVCCSHQSNRFGCVPCTNQIAALGYVFRTNQSVVFVLWFERCSNFNEVGGDLERVVVEYSKIEQIIAKADRGKATAWRSVSCEMTCYHIPDEKSLKNSSLHFVLTVIRGTNTVYFRLQIFAQHTQSTTKYLCELIRHFRSFPR